MLFNENIKSLYVHVPFCSSKCSYCDFFSLENRDFRQKKSVIESTVKQIEYFSEFFSFKDIETVYIGGGTPTALPISLLEYLIFSIYDLIDKDLIEFSIEINPETVDEELVIFFRDTPLTRLSTGIQTFSDKHLKILGRNSSSENCFKALELLSKTDCDISLDLISSIPGQSIDDCIHDIRTASAFNPSHISLYSLTIEENTPIAAYYKETDIDDEIWTASAEYLKNSGFEHYEISNFAFNGKKCLHNINYWKMKPYLGCGPSAVSTLFQNNSPLRLYNTSDVSLYLEGEKNIWNIKKDLLDTTDFFIETLMMGFRTSDGIDLHNINNIFSSDIYSIIPETIIKWKRKGMLLETESALMLSDRGRLFHSSFIIDIMNELENSKITLS